MKDTQITGNYYNNGDFRNITFSLDAVKLDPKVILTGNTEDTLSLVNQFYNET